MNALFVSFLLIACFVTSHSTREEPVTPHHNLRKYRPVFVPTHGSTSPFEAGVPLEFYTNPPLDPEIYKEVIEHAKNVERGISSSLAPSVAMERNEPNVMIGGATQLNSHRPDNYFSLV